MGETIVIALGGNAILQSGQKAEFAIQQENIERSAKVLAKLMEQGHRLVLSHGNGPQVGNLLRQNELSTQEVPSFPMDALTSETQGWMGYLFVQSLENELAKCKINKSVVAMVTRIEVDPQDVGFQNPTKPIGSFYTEEEAKRYTEERNWVMKEDSGRGWRRVVASPQPHRVLELPIIQSLVEQGVLVVAGGGGGIPVIRKENGGYRGVESIIDKDKSSCLLAKELHADRFMILTDVEQACLFYGTDKQQGIGEVSAAELEAYEKEGHFAAGSMGPKVLSAIDFAKSTGKPAHICKLDQVEEALTGEKGTWVTLS